MKIKIIIYLLILIFTLFNCSRITNNRNIITIDCSHFPDLRYNNQPTDTALLKATIKSLLIKKSNDTIQINLECVDNIVYSDVLQTITIIRETINSNNKNNIPTIVCNKCINEYSFPTKFQNEKYITLNVDENGHIFMDSKKINLDNLCNELSKTNNTEKIRLICKENLSTENLITIHDKLRKTGLKIVLETVK